MRAWPWSRHSCSSRIRGRSECSSREGTRGEVPRLVHGDRQRDVRHHQAISRNGVLGGGRGRGRHDERSRSPTRDASRQPSGRSRRRACRDRRTPWRGRTRRRRCALDRPAPRASESCRIARAETVHSALVMSRITSRIAIVSRNVQARVSSRLRAARSESIERERGGRSERSPTAKLELADARAPRGAAIRPNSVLVRGEAHGDGHARMGRRPEANTSSIRCMAVWRWVRIAVSAASGSWRAMASAMATCSALVAAPWRAW